MRKIFLALTLIILMNQPAFAEPTFIEFMCTNQKEPNQSCKYYKLPDGTQLTITNLNTKTTWSSVFRLWYDKKSTSSAQLIGDMLIAKFDPISNTLLVITPPRFDKSPPKQGNNSFYKIENGQLILQKSIDTTISDEAGLHNITSAPQEINDYITTNGYKFE